MAGSDRGWSACLATRLPVVLIAVASCCLMGIAQAGADTGTVRVEVLHNGRNISEGCLGTLANAQTGELVFLVPEGGALVARVPAGLYSGTVFSAEDHSLPPQILLVTVAAGETVTKTVALGQSPGGALWPGQAGSDDGETGGADESQPGTPGSGPGGEGAPGGEDDGDGDETRPRDDDEGDPRAGRVVIGEIVFSWSAVCRAEEITTYSKKAEDEEYESLLEEEITSRTRQEIVYSGTQRYPLHGFVDSTADYGAGSGEISLTGRGLLQESSRTVFWASCFSEETLNYERRKHTSTGETQAVWQTRTKPWVSRPNVIIYANAVEVQLPDFTQWLDCRIQWRTVDKFDTCSGRKTEEQQWVVEDVGLTLCENVIYQALNDPEFTKQLKMYRPLGAYSHTTNTVRHEYVPEHRLPSSPYETYSAQGYLEFTYTVTYTEYSRNPQ
jgi:hypothetical protein